MRRIFIQICFLGMLVTTSPLWAAYQCCTPAIERINGKIQHLQICNPCEQRHSLSLNMFNPDESFWSKTRGRYFLGVEFGYHFNQENTTTYIPSPFTTSEPLTFVTKPADKNVADIAVNYGLTTRYDRNWSESWGVGYQQSLGQRFDGENFQLPGGAPQLTYHYRLLVREIYFMSRLYFRQANWSYFLTLRGGVALLHTTPVTYTAVPNSGGQAGVFYSSSQTLSRGLLGVGLGLDYRLPRALHNWHLAAGMDYDWAGRYSFLTRFNEDQPNFRIDAGSLTPLRVWLGLRYQLN